jgi:hypothetical protein
MLDVKKSLKILKDHFKTVTPEEFAANLKEFCPELIEEELAHLNSVRKSVDEVSYVRNNKDVLDLVKVINNQRESKDVRFHAIDILCHEIPFFTKQEMNLINDSIDDLFKSPLIENIKVAAHLKVATVELKKRIRVQEQAK